MMQGNPGAFWNDEKVKGHNPFDLEHSANSVSVDNMMLEKPRTHKLLCSREGHVKVKPSTRSCVETQDQVTRCCRSPSATTSGQFLGLKVRRVTLVAGAFSSLNAGSDASSLLVCSSRPPAG